MSISSNRKLEETSFLSKSNSTFIEQMYLKYLNKDANLSAEWKIYFEKLNEETSVAIKELEGPSWGKKTDFKSEQLENIALENKENGLSKNENYNTADFKEASNESIKAIASFENEDLVSVPNPDFGILLYFFFRKRLKKKLKA